MKIGVDIIGLASGTVSGVEQYTLSLLRELIKQNPQDEFHLLAVDYYFKDLTSRLRKTLAGPGHFLLEAANVKLHHLRWPRVPLSLHFSWKLLDQPKADKILGGVDLLFQPVPLLLPLSRGVPRVVTFHDLTPAIYPEFFTLKSRLWHWQMNYPVRAREATCLIAVSWNTRGDLIRLYGIDPRKIRVITEGVDPVFGEALGESDLAAVKEKFGLPDEFILYLGSLEPRKNVSVALRALRYLKENGFAKIKLVLAGSKMWGEKAFWREVDSLNLSRECLFLGWVEEKEKLALFKLAQAFLFPSFYEGFGLPALEALAAGCPAVVSSAASLPEVTGETALLVDPFDQAAWNRTLLELLNNPTLKAELGQRGLARAKLFGWREAARQTMQLFKQTASQGGY